MEWQRHEELQYWETTDGRYSISYFPSSRTYALTKNYQRTRTSLRDSLEEAQAMAVQWEREQQESQGGADLSEASLDSAQKGA